MVCSYRTMLCSDWIDVQYLSLVRDVLKVLHGLLQGLLHLRKLPPVCLPLFQQPAQLLCCCLCLSLHSAHLLGQRLSLGCVA